MSKLKRKAKASLEIPSDLSPSKEKNAKLNLLKSPYFATEAGSSESKGSGDQNVNKFSSSKRLKSLFYQKDCLQLSKDLLGQILVRKCPNTGELLCGKIVETEAYLGKEDKAAHSYKGKVTDKNSAMFMAPGTAYVYHIYGIHCCMNVSSEGEGAAVLLRALEPIHGQDVMDQNRGKQRKDGAKALKPKELSNGPSKFCHALGITKNSINKQDLTSSPDVWIVAGEEIADSRRVVSKRINIGYAEDWTDKPFRFYVLDNVCVSARDKEAEKTLQSK